MPGSGALRMALGALKDSTTLGLATLNTHYRELEMAIILATNHSESPPKERHINAIFTMISASRPRSNIAHCIRILGRRLSKTNNWAVALKTLIVIHRALRQVGPTFRNELFNYGRSKSHVLYLSNFKDNSSQNAWDYSAWVRAYALFLEERLECFYALKFDVETECSRMGELDTADLLEQLPSLQQLLSSLLACQPQGAAGSNCIIQLALSLVAGESIRIFNAINDATFNLVDKFFGMKQHHTLRALEIYRKARQQASNLSEFYEVCKGLDPRGAESFVKIEQSPSFFLTAMEEFVKGAPRASTDRREMVLYSNPAPKALLALEYKTTPEVQRPPPLYSSLSKPVKLEMATYAPTVDLLGPKNTTPIAYTAHVENPLALTFIPSGTQNVTASCGHDVANGITGTSKLPASGELDAANGITGWELALVTEPISIAGSNLDGGQTKFAWDGSYENVLETCGMQNMNASERQGTQKGSYNSRKVVPNPFDAQQDIYDAPNMISMAPFKMEFKAHQQHDFMIQQQMMANQQHQPLNPFSYPSEDMQIQPYGLCLPFQSPPLPYKVRI
ncbi:putative clathrin assembly protein At5g35200 isoform X2 [Amborella trichopoda]|nr:putative clathrin assembly protein At5g35200 isoform X2 [Amborella trichopoda]|eukprot:XP_006856558.2 putative clathrin assembly protein At5g35200 isoform X2 [Amborella trichopoda]